MITKNDLANANARVNLPASDKPHKGCVLIDINADYSKPDENGNSKVRYYMDVQADGTIYNITLFNEVSLQIAVGQLIQQLKLKMTNTIEVLETLINKKMPFTVKAVATSYDKVDPVTKEKTPTPAINYDFTGIDIARTSNATKAKLNAAQIKL